LKLYDNTAKSLVGSRNEIIESESEGIVSTQARKKLNVTLDHLPQAMAENLRNSKYFQDHPTVLKNTFEKSATTYEEDPNLLPGWKVKYYSRPAMGPRPGRSDRVFLSPEFMQIRSTFGVLEYMRCAGYSSSQIKQVAACLPNVRKFK